MGKYTDDTMPMRWQYILAAGVSAGMWWCLWRGWDAFARVVLGGTR